MTEVWATGLGERGRAPWITIAGLLAVLVVAAAIVVTVASRNPAPGGPLADMPGDDVIERALALARADSAAIKRAWVDEIPELSLDDMAPARRELFLRLVNSRECTCGCGYTLGACRNYDPTCDVSGPLVAALLDSVRAGAAFDEKGLRMRPQEAR